MHNDCAQLLGCCADVHCKLNTIFIHIILLESKAICFVQSFFWSFNYRIYFQDPETIFPLFRISYHWIAPLGLLATLIVGAIVGYFFDERDSSKMDAELFTPVIWRLLPNEAHENAGLTRRALNTKTVESPTPSAPLILERIPDKVGKPNYIGLLSFLL